jgi:predicted RNase H-like HicB family nuclease
VARTMIEDIGEGQAAQRSITLNIYSEDGDYILECIEFGTVGQGSTLEDALADWAEATEIYLERRPDLSAALVISHRPSLVEGVRELERAYSERIGEPVEPSDIRLIRTISLPFSYA